MVNVNFSLYNFIRIYFLLEEHGESRRVQVQGLGRIFTVMVLRHEISMISAGNKDEPIRGSAGCFLPN